VSDQSIFIAMVFAVGFLMTQAFVRPLMGTSVRSRRRLRERILNVSRDPETEGHVSLVRERYLKDLSPLELRLLRLPGMRRLQSLIEQAGSRQLPHRLLLTSLAVAAAAGACAGYLLGFGLGSALIAALAGAVPVLQLKRRRAKRLARFEEQLPDALTIVARALRAGLPFNEAINLVSQEMKEPVGTEFGIAFSEINYGGDTRTALLGLQERVPSVAVMAMVTSVLIQRETGGNLAELLDKLSDVLRKRFRFQRGVRTLSSEGRATAWILSLLPFVLAAIISLINPDFIPMLTEDPTGRKLVLMAFGLMTVGILWLSRIVRIDV
jgi:tight adherence protein B